MVDGNYLPDCALSVGLCLRKPKEFWVSVTHAEYVSTCGCQNQGALIDCVPRDDRQGLLLIPRPCSPAHVVARAERLPERLVQSHI